MGLLDVPRGLISRLPLIGGSNDSKDDSDEEPEAPVADAPKVEEPDVKPDEPDAKPDEPEPEDEKPEAPDEKPDEPDEDEPDDDGPADDSGAEDISGTTAPSIGPNTVIEKDSPEERLARHDQSDKDAMGLDKRREVIGGNYGAGFGKQMLSWLAVVVVVAAAAFGLKLLVDDLDQPPAHAADQAPWSGNDKAPAPLE